MLFPFSRPRRQLKRVRFKRLVVDEAAALKEDRWHGELEPALMDYNGCAMFIGTPKGRLNWFCKLHERGLDSTQTLYQSWCFSSYENTPEKGGFIPKENIDAIAADMPSHLLDQEIFAKFLEGEGTVFRYLTRQIKTGIPPLRPNEAVWIGLDVAKTVDFTVLVALRKNGEVVGFERFNNLDWDFQKDRIRQFCKGFGKYILTVDATGVGDPIYDGLRRQGVNVRPYKFSNTTKRELIEGLSHMIDSGNIWFPGDPTRKEFRGDMRVLQSELEMFGYELGSQDTVYYGAPEGFHDDCVIALALAAWLIRPEANQGVVIPFRVMGGMY